MGGLGLPCVDCLVPKMALPSSCCPAGFWGEVLVTVGAPCPAGTLLLDPVVRALACFQSTFTFVSPRHRHSRCTVDVVPTADEDEDGSPQEEEAPPRPVGLPRVNSSPWLSPVCGCVVEGQGELVRRSRRVIGNRWGVTRALAALTLGPGCQGLSRELAELPVERIEGKMEETGTGKEVKVQERKTVIADR